MEEETYSPPSESHLSSSGPFGNFDLSASKRLSRYHTDFEEIKKLGTGAFGAVFKCRNRLDGLFYAIKKVKDKDPGLSKKLEREVTTLAQVLARAHCQLNHQHVVRYYQAWREVVDPSDPQSPSGSDSDSESESSSISSSDGTLGKTYHLTAKAFIPISLIRFGSKAVAVCSALKGTAPKARTTTKMTRPATGMTA